MKITRTTTTTTESEHDDRGKPVKRKTVRREYTHIYTREEYLSALGIPSDALIHETNEVNHLKVGMPGDYLDGKIGIAIRWSIEEDIV